MSIFDFLTFIYLKKTIWSSLKYLNCEKSNIFFASDKKITPKNMQNSLLRDCSVSGPKKRVPDHESPDRRSRSIRTKIRAGPRIVFISFGPVLINQFGMSEV